MSLLNLQHLNQNIKDKLFEISYKIECFNKTGDFDISKYAEIYFKELLNIIYEKDGWNFKKAEKINQDTYDLFDIESKVCVQITSNKRQSKKDDTIKLFKKNNHISKFKTLIILFISNKKPQKNNHSSIEFEYHDYNIIEFSSLIETKCNQSDLLKIRDVLFMNFSIPKSEKSDITAKTPKTTKREFLRCIKLEEELKKELLYPNYWEVVDREELSKNPTQKFKDSRFILRAIDDKTYPIVNEDSKWSRTFMYDFYDKGILIWLDNWIGNKAVINEKKEWYIKDKFDKQTFFSGQTYEVSIRILGKLPYKHIVHYKDSDEYYNDYHLYCDYSGVDNSPFEGIVYMAENTMGFFWAELDKSKMIDI